MLNFKISKLGYLALISSCPALALSVSRNVGLRDKTSCCVTKRRVAWQRKSQNWIRRSYSSTSFLPCIIISRSWHKDLVWRKFPVGIGGEGSAGAFKFPYLVRNTPEFPTPSLVVCQVFANCFFFFVFVFVFFFFQFLQFAFSTFPLPRLLGLPQIYRPLPSLPTPPPPPPAIIGVDSNYKKHISRSRMGICGYCYHASALIYYRNNLKFRLWFL